MRLYTTVFVLGILVVSCDHKRDVKKLRQVYKQTTYDSNVIKSLPLYDSLKDIIVSNFDTIFSFRNSRHFVFSSDANGDTATIQEDAERYEFYYNYGEATALSYGTGSNNQKLIDEVSVENMPAMIYPSVDTIFRKLGKDKILGFSLSTDSTIEISLKGFRKDNIDVYHTLTWNRVFEKSSGPDSFYRDTMIASKWTYGIWVDEHIGW